MQANSPWQPLAGEEEHGPSNIEYTDAAPPWEDQYVNSPSKYLEQLENSPESPAHSDSTSSCPNCLHESLSKDEETTSLSSLYAELCPKVTQASTLLDIDALLMEAYVTLPPGRLIYHKTVQVRNHRLLALLSVSRYRELMNEIDHSGRAPIHIAVMMADATAVQILLSYPIIHDMPVPQAFCIASTFFASMPLSHLALYSGTSPEKHQAICVIYGLLAGYYKLLNEAQEAIKLHEASQANAGGPTELEESVEEYAAQVCVDPTFSQLTNWSVELLPIVKKEPTTKRRRCQQQPLFQLTEFLVGNVGSLTPFKGLDAVDIFGRTALHRSAGLGLVEVVQCLLDHKAQLFAKDIYDDMAIHHAIDFGSDKILSLLLDNMHRALQNKDENLNLTVVVSLVSLFKRCILRGCWTCLGSLILNEAYSQNPISEVDFDHLAEFAALCGFSNEFASAFHQAVDGVMPSSNLFAETEQYGSRVRLYSHSDCLDHLQLPSETLMLSNKFLKLLSKYPENPSRLHCLISEFSGVLRSSCFPYIPIHMNPSRACIADILRVHEWSYIFRVQQLSTQTNQQVNSSFYYSDQTYPLEELDEDTPVTPCSWAAACAASGAVLAAVQAVCTGQIRSAFCAIRPPGHHVGAWGPCQLSHDPYTRWQSTQTEDLSAGSQGFCLINNVAVGAAYARYTFLDIKRIAIVDFDIHHGNGTEQIVNSSKTGDFSLNIQYTEPFWKPWNNEQDAENVCFISIHGYGNDFYPGTGEDSDGNQHPHTHNIPIYRGATPQEYREAFVNRCIGALVAFQPGEMPQVDELREFPDIIFISAGFDGHAMDIMQHMFGGLTETDFEWMTRYLVAVANDFCQGRIVSVLEGGYNTKGGFLSPLAASVAAHVRVLYETSYELSLQSMNFLASTDNWKLYVPSANLSHQDDESSDKYAECMSEDQLLMMRRKPRLAAIKAMTSIEAHNRSHMPPSNEAVDSIAAQEVLPTSN